MVKLFFFTTGDNLEKIKQTLTISLTSRTLFAPALNGIYFVDRDPAEQNRLLQGVQFDHYVEIEFQNFEALVPCAPEGGAKVFLYQRPVLELSQFKWSSGYNSEWKPGWGWGTWLGIGVAVGAAAVAGKMAYDQYNKSTDGTNHTPGGPVKSRTEAPTKVKSLEYIGNSGTFKNTRGSQKSQDCGEEDFVRVSEYLNATGTEMSQANQLEALYTRKVKVDELDQRRYRSLLDFLVEDVVSKMRESSTTFRALFSKIYYGGSFFDGLKVGSTDQEFDLNIIFKWREDHLEVVRLGEDSNRRNFCFLKVTKPQLSKAEEKIVDTDQYGQSPVVYLSPVKMFNLIKSCIDRVLSMEGNTFSYNGNLYRVTRHEFAPVTLKVVSLDQIEDPVRFEVDLVPSLQFGLSVLDGNVQLQNQVTSLCNRYQVPAHKQNCMAISLHRADHVKFELDFHDIERRILYDRGCVKKVIKLVKYLRDNKGGTVSKLWSHLLKVSLNLCENVNLFIQLACACACDRRTCALKALGLLLADSALTVGWGQTFWGVGWVCLGKRP